MLGGGHGVADDGVGGSAAAGTSLKGLLERKDAHEEARELSVLLLDLGAQAAVVQVGRKQRDAHDDVGGAEEHEEPVEPRLLLVGSRGCRRRLHGPGLGAPAAGCSRGPELLGHALEGRELPGGPVPEAVRGDADGAQDVVVRGEGELPLDGLDLCQDLVGHLLLGCELGGLAREPAAVRLLSGKSELVSRVSNATG